MISHSTLDDTLTRLQQAGRLLFKKNAPLSSCCSFKIGGPADYLIYPLSVPALTEVIALLKREKVGYLVFGNGTNVLFSDEGLRGAAIFTGKLCSLSIEGDTLLCDAGVPITHAASFAQKNGLTGMEFTYGIPGSCGGAVYMNAGAYEGTVSQFLTETMALDPETGETAVFSAKEHDFSYRHSIFMENRHIILSSRFRLKKGNPETILSVMNDYMARRVEKQPLDYPSAGSVFKRLPGTYTGKLIEEAGLKGKTIGGAQISEKHAGFIINRGGATCSDVLSLIRFTQDTLKERFGLCPECEVRYIPPVLPEI